MSFDAAAVDAVFAAVRSKALSTGHFQRVNQHEPKNAPPNGLTAALWLDYLGPAPVGSGLRATTAVVRFNLRIYQSMLSEPQDAIDPDVTKATTTLIAAYSSDYTLGGQIRNVDLLGQAGVPLQAQAGYLDIAGQMNRVVTVMIPCIVNDAWSQI